jgi:hypothetical protein
MRVRLPGLRIIIMVKANILDNVRATCRAVAEKATHVRINEDFIPAYARSLPLQNAISPELDPHRHYLDRGKGTLAFILTLDSINFGSGYFPHLQKRPGMSGYFTVAGSLNDYFRDHGPFSARQLGDITGVECATIFCQDLEKPPVRELLQHFAAALNSLGRYLLDTFDGEFDNLVAAADSSANRLVEILIKMPYFDDVELYDKARVAFYKRAQLTAADLALAFDGSGWGRFDDLDELTIFADNVVPHVLRVDNILIYEKNLLNRINAGTLIAPGSTQEIEIRACAVHAVELLKDEIRNSFPQVTSSGLDYLLWNRGQQPSYKAQPRHRTRTVFY